ncbi:MAG TPA: UbiX family flavin prenyltransferase [Nitrososphaerales archaeon]|nr:UbiX family flavin prenyltransferase [Nitrososphaerales archaeon]
MEKNRIFVIGMTGASGVIYGIRLLEVLKRAKIETHLVLTPAAKITIAAETDFAIPTVEKLATKVHRYNDIAASISSGSFKTDGMIVIPCSMHAVGALASGVSDNLLLRAAEVTMKERRLLVLVPRETPLTLIHIENMERVARAGACILPAMPGFYERPKSVSQMVDHLVGKVLDIAGIEHDLFKRWKGLPNDDM